MEFITVGPTEDCLNIRVPKGEVRLYEIKFPHTGSSSHAMWDAIKAGEYKKPNDGMLYYAVYKKTDGKEEDILSLTVDTREFRAEAVVPIDRNAGSINIEVLNRNAETTECILSIDLGNTRTVSLLIDQVNTMHDIAGTDDVTVYPVPMKWSQKQNETIKESFESIVSLTDSANLDGNSWCDDNRRQSFIKMGEFALFNNRAANTTDGDYTLSSPKRYFWDLDPAKKDWYAVRYGNGSENTQEVTLDQNPLAQELKKLYTQTTSSRLPKAAMLAAMVVELYEQAIYYVSSKEFKDKTEDSNPRKITKIHVTYPSTLSPEEKELYRQQLKNGLDAYHALFPLAPSAHDVELVTDIDEATAVLALYVFSEIKKYNNADFWLRTIGQQTATGSEARVAVIDIGGGTTDLSVSTVSVNAALVKTDPTHADMNLLYRDGVNSAGDDFILNFLSLCSRKIFEGVFQKVGKSKDDWPKLMKDYNEPENRDKVAGLKRSFWVKIVIGLAQACDAILDANGTAAYSSDLPKMSDGDDQTRKYQYEFSQDDKASWEKFIGQDSVDSNPLEITIDDDLLVSYVAAVQDTFIGAAVSFGRAIYAYDADIVLFSGKTAEFYYVRKCFEAFIGLDPKTAIKPMKDFLVGKWCQGVTDGKYKISDSKVSTALGGALYTLRENSFVSLSFDFSCVANPDCIWGVVPPKTITIPPHLSLFNATNEEIVPFNGKPKILARQNEFSETAILSYEIRLKPEYQGERMAADSTITIAKDIRTGRLSIKECSGKYENGDLLAIDHIELRICNKSEVFGFDEETVDYK